MLVDQSTDATMHGGSAAFVPMHHSPKLPVESARLVHVVGREVQAWCFSFAVQRERPPVNPLSGLLW
jgi:hypothetical protein